MGQNFDDHSDFQKIPGMPILLQHSVSCSMLAGTLNCMMKKTTEMLEFTPEIILISEV